MLEKFVELIINCIYDLSVDNISKETDKLIDRIKKSVRAWLFQPFRVQLNQPI